jgi:hypothetical protein
MHSFADGRLSRIFSTLLRIFVNISALLGTTGIIRDQRYRTEADAGMTD